VLLQLQDVRPPERAGEPRALAKPHPRALVGSAQRPVRFDEQSWRGAKVDHLAQDLEPAAHGLVIGRELEREIIPAVRDLGLGTFIWSPLASGFLSGKYTRDADGSGRRAAFDFPPVAKEQGGDIIETLAQVAEEKDASVAQIALAWLLHRHGVTSVIVGARKEAQLVDNLNAADISLSDAEMARLDEVSALKPEYPGYLPVWRRGDTLFSQLHD